MQPNKDNPGQQDSHRWAGLTKRTLRYNSRPGVSAVDSRVPKTTLNDCTCTVAVLSCSVHYSLRTHTSNSRMNTDRVRETYRTDIPVKRSARLNKTYPGPAARSRHTRRQDWQGTSPRPVFHHQSLSDDNDLGLDGFDAVATECKPLGRPPAGVPKEYTDVPGRPQSHKSHPKRFLRCLGVHWDTFDHPDDSSSIRIMHEHADYPTIGDEFGMTLKTFENKDFKDGQHYFRHFLTEIAANSPASKLHIHELDELVLLNKDFVPNKTHKNVVDLFKHIPVDSKTELTMVIRRENQKDIFTWISISAILVPVYDHEPKVIKVKVHDLGEEYKDQRWLLLKVQGQPLYMTPGNDTALCTHLKNDQSDRNKEVLITTQMDTVGRRILFKSSIQFKNNKYLVMDEQGGQPLLKSTQFWYGYNTSGSWASFKSQDERYIGYSNLDNQLTLVDGDYKFETFPPQGTFDHTDAPNGSDVTTREYAECMETRNMKTPLRNKISNNDSGMSSLCDSDLELDLESSYGSFTESLIENGGSTAQNSSMDSLSGSSLPARIHPMVTRQMSASTEMCKLSLT